MDQPHKFKFTTTAIFFLASNIENNLWELMWYFSLHALGTNTLDLEQTH